METQTQKPRYRMKVVKDWNTFDELNAKGYRSIFLNQNTIKGFVYFFIKIS